MHEGITPPTAKRLEQEEEPEKAELIDIVGQNLEAIVEHQLRVEQGIDQHQRSIETVIKNVGRPRFLYGCVLAIACWISVQAVLVLAGMKSFDPPPFSWLQGVMSLSALLITTMVLIASNRQDQHAEQRRHLDLQVVLLVEQKVTKVVALLEELRRDLPSVQNRHDPQAEAMQEVIDPQAVLAALDEMLHEGHNEGDETQVS